MSILLTNKGSLIFFCLLISQIFIGQIGCVPDKLPFISGEELIYDVEYHMGNTWVSAAKARFIVKDSTYNNNPCYYLEGKGRTLKSYDWFFKVRDKYASFISTKDHKPIHFIRRVREGDFYLNYDYDFDYKNRKAFIEEKRKNIARQDTMDLIPCSYDILSSVYFSRAIDFNKLNKGDTIPIDIILDKEMFSDIGIIYNGTKVIKDQQQRKIECIHFEIELIEGTIFKGNETMDVYVTNDENKIPIYVEAEILVGSIRVYIKSIKNSKRPLTYIP